MFASLVLVSSVTLGSWVPRVTPTIPMTYTSNVVATTAGTVPGAPVGTHSYTEVCESVFF